MLKNLGNGFIQGDFLYYHDLGKVKPDATTNIFELTNRQKGTVIGHVKWLTFWQRYVFYPLNCVLDGRCMREISDFCDFQTHEQKKKRKERKNKFNKTYDMSNRKDKGQMKLRYNSMVE